MKNFKNVLAYSLFKNKLAIIISITAVILNTVIFKLYNITTEPFVYCTVLLAVILFVLLTLDFIKELKNHKQREIAAKNILISNIETLDFNTLVDKDYAEMIQSLNREITKLQNDFSLKQQADDDYYTAWVHQIKTPISVLKLQLSADTDENKALLSEIFRIEQYVEMVLDYIRLESISNDLVIKEYSADEIIKETLRKFAPQFILRKLKLNYKSVDYTVVTDRKWLSFILEQLISNAIKYTKNGEINITATENSITVSDTGIGISPEDLPRIFEKGYTGVNGRLGEKSSGLGLFLTKKAATLISVKLNVESVVGKGTSFTVIFSDNFSHFS